MEYGQSMYIPKYADAELTARIKRDCLNRLMLTIGPCLLERPARVAISEETRDTNCRGTEYILRATIT